MGILKFPANKGKTDRFLLVFPGREAQDGGFVSLALAHNHQVCRCYSKSYLFISPADFLQGDHQDFFFFLSLLGCFQSSVRLASTSLTVGSVYLLEKALSRGGSGWGDAQRGGSGRVCGETQGLQLGLPQWQRLSGGGSLSISSSGYRLWKTSFP